MHNKIRYRLVFNRSGRLNKQGEGLIQIEMEQQRRRLYISTHTYVKPEHWQGGMVSESHPNAAGLNAYLIRQKMDCEAVELGYVSQGVNATVSMVRDAIRLKMTPGAKVYDFICGMIETGNRKTNTRQGYMTLANSLQRFRKNALITDIDYQFLTRYEAALKAKKLAHNTIVGRMSQLRAVMNEAVRRKVVPQNPFRQLPDRAHGIKARIFDIRASRAA